MKRALGRLVLMLSGWKLAGPPPAIDRYVLIAAPHTTNWDLWYLLALGWSAEVPISWMGKHALFKGPLGPITRYLGGIEVRRSQRNDLVAVMAEAFERNPNLVLVVPSEATRSRAEYWKSGFYRIAQAAGVPIITGFLDYPKREGGFGPPIEPSGDLKRDMDRIRAFYADKVGKYPENFGPVRLADESSEALR